MGCLKTNIVLLNNPLNVTIRTSLLNSNYYLINKPFKTYITYKPFKTIISLLNKTITTKVSIINKLNINCGLICTVGEKYIRVTPETIKEIESVENVKVSIESNTKWKITIDY